MDSLEHLYDQLINAACLLQSVGDLNAHTLSSVLLNMFTKTFTDLFIHKYRVHIIKLVARKTMANCEST